MKVFISYTTPDINVAKSVYRELKRFFPCWIACEDLRTDHEIGIQQELAAEDSVMVALVSRSTFTSPGQKKEFRIADNFRTETIPVLIEDISHICSEIENNLRNRIADKRAFVSYALHGGQYYLGYSDPNWFSKLIDRIRNANDLAMSEFNRILIKLRKSNIFVNEDLSSRRELVTIWELEWNQPPIHIVFDARPTKAINQSGDWEEFISVRGITRTKGYEESDLLKAIDAFKENGRWGLKNTSQESLEFEITNAFPVALSSPSSTWVQCCKNICNNILGVCAELDRPKTFWDKLSDLFEGISEGIGAGLSIAEQLGLFNQENDDDCD